VILCSSESLPPMMLNLYRNGSDVDPITDGVQHLGISSTQASVSINAFAGSALRRMYFLDLFMWMWIPVLQMSRERQAAGRAQPPSRAAASDITLGTEAAPALPMCGLI
jgi:hypothetical protein